MVAALALGASAREGVRVRVPSSANMLNIEEVKEATWKSQERDFEKNLSCCREKIDAAILIDAEKGHTQSVFRRNHNLKNIYFGSGRNLFILDKRICKVIKKEYRQAGFRVKKTANCLKISWYK